MSASKKKERRNLVFRRPPSSRGVQKAHLKGQQRDKPTNHKLQPQPFKAVPVQETKQISKSKRGNAGNDIDDIFSSLSNVQKSKTITKPQPKGTKGTSNRDGAPSKDDKDFWADSRGDKGGKRKKVDGLYVYTEEELGIRGDSGGTALCPFDCNCCFI